MAYEKDHPRYGEDSILELQPGSHRWACALRGLYSGFLLGRWGAVGSREPPGPQCKLAPCGNQNPGKVEMKRINFNIFMKLCGYCPEGEVWDHCDSRVSDGVPVLLQSSASKRLWSSFNSICRVGDETNKRLEQ